MPTLLGFSDGSSLALPLPLSGRATAVRADGGAFAFIGIVLSARGTKDGLMSSMGSRLIGHASPSATCFASDGSIYLNERARRMSKRNRRSQFLAARHNTGRETPRHDHSHDAARRAHAQTMLDTHAPIYASFSESQTSSTGTGVR